MKAGQDKRPSEIFIWLGLGASLNLALLLFLPNIAIWSTVQREFWIAFGPSALGVSAIVCVLPIMWYGKTWQPVVALSLMVLPTLSLFLAVDFLLHYK
jgi:hypothetical protein